LDKGYEEELIKKAVINAGYTLDHYTHALKVVEKESIPHTPGDDWKKDIILVYTILSLSLSLFSIEFIALNLASSIILDYILLIMFSIMLAYVSFFTLRKVTGENFFWTGYLIPLSVIIDLFMNKRIELVYLAIPLSYFFFASTYHIVQSAKF